MLYTVFQILHEEFAILCIFVLRDCELLPHAIQKYKKICKLGKAIFSVFYNISQPNFGICLILKGSFRDFSFSRLDKKYGYNSNCPFSCEYFGSFASYTCPSETRRRTFGLKFYEVFRNPLFLFLQAAVCAYSTLNVFHRLACTVQLWLIIFATFYLEILDQWFNTHVKLIVTRSIQNLLYKFNYNRQFSEETCKFSGFFKLTVPVFHQDTFQISFR